MGVTAMDSKQPRNTEIKDQRGADILEYDLLFNPCFGDIWVVAENEEHVWTAILTHDGLSEDLENVGQSFIKCGSVWGIA